MELFGHSSPASLASGSNSLLIGDKCYRLPATVRQIARSVQIVTLLAVPVVALCGRSIERAFPLLAPSIPLAGIGLIALATAAFLLRRARQYSRMQVRWQISLQRSALLFLALPLLLVIGMENMIVAPIERIHFVKYGLLSGSTFFVADRAALSRSVIAFIFGSTIGSLEEASQLFIPGRVYDPRDLLLNCSGALFGVMYALCLVLCMPATAYIRPLPAGPEADAPAAASK